MTQITLCVPDDLATRLEALEQSELSRIVELGYQSWAVEASEAFAGVRDVLERLASLPSAQEVLAMRPSAALEARISELLEKNRSDALSEDEQKEWQVYEYLEHLVRLAKAKAALRLKAAS